MNNNLVEKGITWGDLKEAGVTWGDLEKCSLTWDDLANGNTAKIKNELNKVITRKKNEEALSNSKIKARIIAIDGLDGCFKNTICTYLFKIILKKNINVEVFHFPSDDSKRGYFAHQYLEGKYGKDVDPYIASMFYLADFYDAFFTNRIIEDKNAIIVCDRYTLSNKLYQSAKFGCNLEAENQFLDWLVLMEEKAQLKLPDSAIFIGGSSEFVKNSVDTRFDRYPHSGEEMDLHERNKSYLERVGKSSFHIASLFGYNTIYIDTEAAEHNMAYSSDILFPQVIDIINNDLGLDLSYEL